MLAFAAPKTAKKLDPSDTRQKVWDIRFDQFLKEPAGWTYVRHETEAVAFSPDDTRLAVTVTHHQQVAERNFLRNSHLFIMDVNSPEANVRQFDLSQTCGVGLTWNERGDAILVCGKILRLVDGATCTVSPAPPGLSRHYSPYQAFWLDSDHVIRRNGDTLDLACNQVDRRPVPACTIGAVAQRLSESKLLWPCQPERRLAAGADAYCFSTYYPSAGKTDLQCRAIQGDSEIPVPKQLREYRVTQATHSSGRFIADKWEPPHKPWWEVLFFWWAPDAGSHSLPQKRVVFDLHTGKLISSWKPQIQTSNSAHLEDWPHHCAISGHGELVAESGDGVLEVYRLAP
jgi:hypothetical protein